MASPPKAGRSPEPPDPPGDAAIGGVRQRIRRRVAETQAALVLERAGEVEEAARVFEAAEAHDQAAALRLEHARALREPEERLAALRESCARAVGDSPEVRALHKALARALVHHARAAPAAGRAATLAEAAAALERAAEPALAGELYENLGRLDAAARCYERAGEVARLEEVLLRRERRTLAARTHADLRARADAAWARGERVAAVALLEAHLGQLGAHGQDAPPDLARHLTRLRGLLPPPGPTLRLRLAGAELTLCLAAAAELGRAPDTELVLDGWGISRRHARLQVRAIEDGARPTLEVTDLGSRAGTFLGGEALEPGVPAAVPAATELALGSADPMALTPLRDGPDGPICGAAMDLPGRGRWIFLPGGGPLPLPALDPAPRVEPPGATHRLALPPGLGAHLSGTRLAAGARVDLLPGDRLLLDPDGAAIRLEVLP